MVVGMVVVEVGVGGGGDEEKYAQSVPRQFSLLSDLVHLASTALRDEKKKTKNKKHVANYTVDTLSTLTFH